MLSIKTREMDSNQCTCCLNSACSALTPIWASPKFDDLSWKIDCSLWASWSCSRYHYWWCYFDDGCCYDYFGLVSVLRSGSYAGSFLELDVSPDQDFLCKWKNKGIDHKEIMAKYVCYVARSYALQKLMIQKIWRARE